MRIVDILSEDLIVAQMEARDKSSAIEEVVSHIIRVQPSVDQQNAVDVLTARERLGSTGVGQGFAIPHGKLMGIDQVIACFSRSIPGVSFDARDGHDVHLFLTLLAPQNAAALHLKALARASRLFKNDEFRESLRSAEDRDTLWRLISDYDQKLDQSVRAHE